MTSRGQAMIQNKIVIQYLNGSVMKGSTRDFMPNKEVFHLTPVDAPQDCKPVAVVVRELKAVFFVKDHAGNSQYQEKKEFDRNTPALGKKIKVIFRDGEILIGTTQGYQPGRAGFFIIPADPKSNNDRCYIVSSSTKEVSFI
jgi:hypothetical protein